MEIKKCPCGGTPEKFCLDQEPPAKWTNATPDCCGEWSFEFRSQYERNEAELQKRAIRFWNQLPRG